MIDHFENDGYKYDGDRLSQVDIDALRAIHERIAPTKERQAVREKVEKDDVYTLAHSLDFAE